MSSANTSTTSATNGSTPYTPSVEKSELRNRASSRMANEPMIIKSQDTGDGEPGEIVVNYDSTNHLQLFQMKGSVWPRVLPFCIVNTFLMFACDFWLEPIFTNMGIVFTGKEHGLLTIMVSFLVIRRATMAVGRYEKAGENLTKCLKAGRDLVSDIAIQTSKKQDLEDKEWRNKIAYYTCLLLRLIIASSDYESDKVVPWHIPELHGEIKEKILRHTQMTGITGQWAHATRVEKEEVYRFPLTMMQHLRMALCEKGTSFGGKLLDSINGAYCDLKRHYITPPPFPIIQMSRTIVFLWIFSLPFFVMFDSSPIYAHCIGTFFITAAFVGLELVSIELDDPFGHDANDFDNIPMAQTVYEDIYNIIDIVDGPIWAARVRAQMNDVLPEDAKTVAEEAV